MFFNCINTVKIRLSPDSVGKCEDNKLINKELISYEDFILSLDILSNEE